MRHRLEGDQPPGPGQPQRVLRAWGQDPLEGDGADQQTALRLTPPHPPGIPDPGSGTAPRGEKRVTFECLFRDIMSLNGWVFKKMHVPAANFISPTARVTAAARQAGEEMEGGRRARQRRRSWSRTASGPLRLHCRKEGTRHKRDTERVGQPMNSRYSPSMSAATSWGCHRACPILSPLSLFLPLGLSAPASPAARTTRSLAFLMTNTFSFFRCETHLLSRRSLPTAA